MDLLRTVGESALIAGVVIGIGMFRMHWMRSRDERRQRKAAAR